MKRDEQLQRLHENPEFDILIIGGGATGLGCAIDAASRGYRTCLLEQSDFAKGTSSRATKLVHGGVRYLAQGNIRLVKEALKERAHLLQNAPHVCHNLDLVVPAFSFSQYWYYKMGLQVYDWLSGKWSLGATQGLSKKATLTLLPSLLPKKLKGGILYKDGQFDDSRLAIHLAQTAIEQGAVVLNYSSVTGFLKSNNRICGVMMRNELSQTATKIKAKAVVNATGVFADAILQMDQPEASATIAPSQGIHLVVDVQYFEGITGLMIPKTDDGRVLFAIPWHGKVLLGTTDTPVDNASTEPRALGAEIEFILQHVNRYINRPINRKDVRSVFAGLRPLQKQKNTGKTSLMPRDHQVVVLPSGLVHITGGKWTTYRIMAEQAITKAAEVAALTAKPSITQQLPIHGSGSVAVPKHLEVYGTDAARIIAIESTRPGMSALIHPCYPFTLAQVAWAMEEEMAITIEDVLSRRIRLLYLDARAAITAAPVVAEILYPMSTPVEREMAVKKFLETAQVYLT